MRELSTPLQPTEKGHEANPGATDGAATTVSGHLSTSGKDDAGKQADIKDGLLSGILVSPQWKFGLAGKIK